MSFKHITALSLGAESRRPLISEAAQDFHWLRENIPCQAACPAGTDIPGYLEAIYHGRFRDAYEINLRDNVFPPFSAGLLASVRGSLSPRLGRQRQPVAICFSKRSAADFYHQRPIVLPRCLVRRASV